MINKVAVKNMPSKLWVRLLLCASLCVVSRPAVAQTGLGHIGPSGAQVAGAIVGAAAVIGLVVYLVIPKQKTIEGCVAAVNSVSTLSNEKDHRAYVLLTDEVSVQPGHQFKLKGKKAKDKSGNWQFRVKKIVQDEGPCQQQ